jgi:hypothetical protein
MGSVQPGGRSKSLLERSRLKLSDLFSLASKTRAPH